MTDLTLLDQAHATMTGSPGDDAARLRFYERLAHAELFVLLDEEPGADKEQVTPSLFEVGGERYVLVFDLVERLSGFVGQPAPYIAVSGRVLAGMLLGQGIGLAVNPDVAPSSILLPDTAVAWLNDMLANEPDEVDAQVAEIYAPGGLPEDLITALDTRLASAMGLAAAAYLVGVRFADGARGHMLGIVDAVPGAETALARAASEALTFSGIDAGAMDVAFFRASDAITGRLARNGLRFDLPQPQAPLSAPSVAPGSDPDKPPRLR